MIKTAKTDNPIHDLLKERWSPRAFAEKEITDEHINQLFEAARWAASASNEQPWRFIYARRGTDAHAKFVSCLSDFNQQWVNNAPVLVITAYKEKTSSGKVNFHALHDLGLSMGNLTFQAQSMGIAVHQMAGINWEKVQKIFNVPEGFHITTAVALGYYGGNPEALPEALEKTETTPRMRKPLSEIATEGAWNFKEANE